MILAIFKALFAIGCSLMLALSAIAFCMFLYDELKEKKEEHDNME